MGERALSNGGIDARIVGQSGQWFDEDGFTLEGTYKAAEARYTHVDQVDRDALDRWLENARRIQWDYKNVVKRKERLERLR